MPAPPIRSDLELLAASVLEPEAFGEFYRRHERAILLYMRRRTGSAELAADLTAEVFAAALQACHRSSSAPPETPLAWLFGIAHHKLIDSYARGRVEDDARRRLGMQPVVLDTGDLELIEQIDQDNIVQALVDSLPADQRAALQERVLAERDYPEIARELCCSESVVRKRVSRGLARLRTQLQEGT
jgi:RNA polymerase sigma-70 factor (ECF subfamily)